MRAAAAISSYAAAYVQSAGDRNAASWMFSYQRQPTTSVCQVSDTSATCPSNCCNICLSSSNSFEARVGLQARCAQLMPHNTVKRRRGGAFKGTLSSDD